uniref:Uncharacterized protein n=1 Tax=Cacopsylla melanoneura TaxID=428564 RepID=A0A8D8TH91_9HEMI
MSILFSLQENRILKLNHSQQSCQLFTSLIPQKVPKFLTILEGARQASFRKANHLTLIRLQPTLKIEVMPLEIIMCLVRTGPTQYQSHLLNKVICTKPSVARTKSYRSKSRT